MGGAADAAQFDFVFRKWAEEVKADPSLAGEQPYKAIIEKDETFFEGIATQDPKVVATLLAAFVRSWAGTTPGEFDEQVRAWLTAVNQPRFGVPYVKLVYQPMLELLDFLKANDWRVFVCSGGGRDFMRVFAEETWGIYKERVIGSAAAYTYADGKLVRSEQLIGSLDLGPGKPEHIFAQTGRLPAFAGGNADVDIEMLEAAKFARKRLKASPLAGWRRASGVGRSCDGQRAGLGGQSHRGHELIPLFANAGHPRRVCRCVASRRTRDSRHSWRIGGAVPTSGRSFVASTNRGHPTLTRLRALRYRGSRQRAQCRTIAFAQTRSHPGREVDRERGLLDPRTLGRELGGFSRDHRCRFRSTGRRSGSPRLSPAPATQQKRLSGWTGCSGACR